MTVAVPVEATTDPDPSGDHSASFHRIRSHLTDEQGRNYTEFVRALKPRYHQVYRDIAIGYAGMIGSAALTVWLDASGIPTLVAGALGAVLIGYWISYLVLFLHEGSHFNLAADRDTSDRLTDGLVGWIAGAPVAQYRKVHFQHHRALGTVADSEHSYFFPLNLLFIGRRSSACARLKC